MMGELASKRLSLSSYVGGRESRVSLKSSTALVARHQLGCLLLSFSSFHTPVRVGSTSAVLQVTARCSSMARARTG